MSEIIKQVQAMSLAKLSTIISLITGCIGLIVLLGTFVVTTSELKETESRIVGKIQSEAVLTRSVFIQELIERKTKLSESLANTNDPGRVAKILEEIRELNQRIEKLRGQK